MRVMSRSPEDAHRDQGRAIVRLADLKVLLAADADFLRPLVQAVLQKFLDAERTEALAAGKGERTPARLGDRAAYYDRMLVTRVGKLELRGAAGSPWPVLHRLVRAPSGTPENVRGPALFLEMHEGWPVAPSTWTA